ncbi:tetratricopeptide repeat protein [Amycolatopsis sp. NPDC098790]|uniref:tetratricopeptide repeat protein n=1 Tax=Amycolatopsis sp. NPDC098790 TaxID=3363939 RepID=UPI00381F912B
MDLDDAVVRLCAEGMQAEAAGRNDDAHALFRQAWDAATDDYGACVAAHYLARHQTTPEDVLRWNQECLERADRVGDERVRGFYPSLHLNLARAHEELGNPDRAREHYRQAAGRLEDAPAGPYRDGMRFTIAAALRPAPKDDDALTELLGKLCERKDFRALGVLLPAYLGDLGTAEDRTALLTAVQMVRLGQSLPEDEAALLAQAMGELTQAGRPAPA